MEIIEYTVYSMLLCRYDVMLFERTRHSVFWTEEDREVRRCTWYYKGDLDREYIPFSETHANRLEGEFQVAVKQNIWPRKVTTVYTELFIALYDLHS